MVLGGLKEGVTPLGWAYAYATLGNNGDRVSGTLAPRPGDSPVAYTQVTDKDGRRSRAATTTRPRTGVRRRETPKTAKSILETVVTSGTGTNAQIGAEGQWGKTGTTENNGDAWFCGGDRDEVDRLRLGRLRRHDDADEDPLQRRPGDGRDVPGVDLGQRDLRLGGHPGRTRGGNEGKRRRARAAKAPKLGEDDRSSYEPPKPTSEPEPNRRRNEARARSRSGAGTEAAPAKRRRPKPAPEAAAANGRRAAAASPPASASAARAGRPGDEAAAGGAEAPGALDGFGDPDPGAGDDLPPVAVLGRQDQERVAAEVGAVVVEADRRAPRSACRGPSRGRGRARVAAARAASPPGRRSAPGPGSAPRRPRPRVRRPR